MTASFERFMVTLHGQRGAAWVAGLPALIADLEARWGLRALPPFPNLSYNYAAPAELADGTPAVLKLGVPGPELLSEMAALGHFGGHGCVRLLACEPELGAMLLERLRPGTMLSTMADDEAATRIAANVMLDLWRPPPAEHRFPQAAEWASGLGRLRALFDGGTGPLPERLVVAAEGYFKELLAAGAEPVLLHGDLHHFNILSSERASWLAIDPKGLVGDRGYEVGALLHNPVGSCLDVPDPAGKLARRVSTLAEMLTMERQRVAMWGMAMAVLSAWWSLEDANEVDHEVLRCAELLDGLVG